MDIALVCAKQLEVLNKVMIFAAKLRNSVVNFLTINGQNLSIFTPKKRRLNNYWVFISLKCNMLWVSKECCPISRDNQGASDESEDYLQGRTRVDRGGTFCQATGMEMCQSQLLLNQWMTADHPVLYKMKYNQWTSSLTTSGDKR